VKTDWEVELGVVIGRRRATWSRPPRRWPASPATRSHDVSEREFQLERGGQWDKGKNCETFNPLGPWLVTADEVPTRRTSGCGCGSTAKQTAHQEHDGIVRYLSQFVVLHPGDVINTGDLRPSRTCAPVTSSSWRSTASAGPASAWSQA
jgi:2-keto-4-pentenoate hydratase/2-oxohepta-3-ene-1,7-dioic acid hydratase in catechol pathway